MNTKVLEYVLAIAEEGSVSRAAERYYLSQPVLSRHLKKIEAELGAPLFTRTAGGMELTRAGIVFVNNARAMLHAANQLEAELAAIRREKKNFLRVLVDETCYNFFIRRVLPQFRRKYPDFLLEISSCNNAQARRALLDGAADLGVYPVRTPQDPELEMLCLMEDELVMVFPPGDVRGATMESLREVIGSGALLPMLHNISSSFRIMEEQQLVGAGVPVTTVMEERSFHNAFMAIQRGQNCGFIPRGMYTRYPGSHLTPTPLRNGFYMVAAYPKSTAFPTQLEELLRILEVQFETYPEYIAAQAQPERGN